MSIGRESDEERQARDEAARHRLDDCPAAQGRRRWSRRAATRAAEAAQGLAKAAQATGAVWTAPTLRWDSASGSGHSASVCSLPPWRRAAGSQLTRPARRPPAARRVCQARSQRQRQPAQCRATYGRLTARSRAHPQRADGQASGRHPRRCGARRCRTAALRAGRAGAGLSTPRWCSCGAVLDREDHTHQQRGRSRSWITDVR